MLLKVFSGGLLGKLLGVAREVLLAWFYGSGSEAAAFRLALTVVLAPLNLFCSDAVMNGLLPKLSDYSESGNQSGFKKLFTAITLLNIFFGITVTICIFYFAYDISVYFVPKATVSELHVFELFIENMSLGAFFYVVYLMLSTACLAKEKSGLFAFRASLQALGMCTGIILSIIFNNIIIFSCAFLVVYLFMSVYALWVSLPYLDFKIKSDFIMTAISFLKDVRWLLFMPIIYQLYWLLEKFYAGQIDIVVISHFEYAKFFTETISNLICIPVGIYILTKNLTSHSFVRLLQDFSRLFVFACLVMIISGDYLISIILEYGEFSVMDKESVYKMLVYLSFALYFQALSFLLVKYFSKQQLYKVVFKAVACSVISAVTFFFVTKEGAKPVYVPIMFLIFNVVFSFILILNFKKLLRIIIFDICIISILFYFSYFLDLSMELKLTALLILSFLAPISLPKIHRVFLMYIGKNKYGT